MMTEEHEARYVIGIDLGTTNSAVAFIDRKLPKRTVRIFPVPQWVAASTLEALDTLPSFHYAPARGEFDEASVRLPWEQGHADHIVGALARDHGAEVPGRLISSAKSWLCHSGVDRTTDILPWQAGEDVPRLSPAAVCSRYLHHMRMAWNAEHPKAPMEHQEVVITVPASFDEVARELTVAAAHQAGLTRIVLIEEPQAAFYNWLDAQGEQGLDSVKEGDVTLVCDVGGGTTDFTLIRAQKTREGSLLFQRVAVGDHLILGGDNLDMTLARYIEETKLPARLTPHQYVVLIRRCRQAKETLLGANPPERLVLHLPTGGSRLIGQALQVELTRAEVLDLLVDGFLPRVPGDAVPQKPVSGFREFGLPFAPDHGITRYLAHFLRLHHAENHQVPLRPDALLLNGGFFAAPELRSRLIEVVRSWFTDDPGWQLRLLENPRLDLAVARGAACYGHTRADGGTRIKAGLPRSYYVGVGSAQLGGGMQALCLAPAGLDEGETVRLDQHIFEIRLHEPVEFPIFCSAVRTTDKPGALIDPDPEQLSALPPIRTVLRSGKLKQAAAAQVRIEARAGETGTLEIACREIGGDRAWRLQFDVRSTTQTDIRAHGGEAERRGIIEETIVDQARALLGETFAGTGSPDQSLKQLEGILGTTRGEWPPSVLRALWEELMTLEQKRLRTVAHEIRWYNLAGFCLRPGYGYALDDWRVGRLWQLLSRHRPEFSRNEQCCAEWWVMWRRTGGGLKANQQRNLAQPLLATLRSAGKAKKKNLFGVGPHETAEIWRLLASLEWLDAGTKTHLGELALSAMEREGVGAWNKAACWALARLGARVPLYGAVNTVVSPAVVEQWLERLLEAAFSGPAMHFALMQLARFTNDRFRDVDARLRERAAAYLGECGAPAHYIRLATEGGELENDELGQAFGDGLPPGLRLFRGD